MQCEAPYLFAALVLPEYSDRPAFVTNLVSILYLASVSLHNCNLCSKYRERLADSDESFQIDFITYRASLLVTSTFLLD